MKTSKNFGVKKASKLSLLIETNNILNLQNHLLKMKKKY